MSSLTRYEEPAKAVKELEGTPLLYHEAYKALICEICLHGVFHSKQRVVKHLKMHNITAIKASAVANAMARFEFHDGRAPLAVCLADGTVPTAVKGLVAHSGYHCAKCGLVTRAITPCMNHDKVCNGRIRSVPSTQTFYGNQQESPNAAGPHVLYFVTRVSEPLSICSPGQTAPATMLFAFDQILGATHGLSGATSRPARVALSRLRWAERVQHISHSDTIDLVQKPRVDKGEPEVIEVAFIWTIALVKEANDSLRRRTSFVRTIAFSGIHKTLNYLSDKSVDAYARLLAKFVIFVIRIHLYPRPAVDCHTSFLPAVHIALQALVVTIDDNVKDVEQQHLAVLRVITEIFFCPSVGGSTRPERFLLAWWLPLHFKNSGAFTAACNMTADMGHLDFTARLLLLYSSNLAADKLQESQQTELQSLAAACTLKMTGTSNAYGHLVECRQAMSTEARGNVLMANVSWDDASGIALRVDNSVFTVSAIAAAAQYLVNRSWSRFVNDLCFGHQWNRLANEHPLYDDFPNRQVGFNFTQVPTNQFGDCAHALYNLVIKCPQLRRQFGFSVKQNKLVASAGRIRQYMHAADEFRMDLMAAIHLAYGGPARATELAETRLVNTDQQLRDIIIISGRVALANTYNKTNALTGTTNQVIRILPACLSELVVQYSVLVRPFELVLDRILHPSDRHPLLASHLFVFDRALVSSTKQSSNLQKAFALFGVKDVNVSKYRHAFTAIARRHNIALGTEGDEMYDELEDLLEEQSGHSAGVGRVHYARSTTDWSGMDPNKILLTNLLTDRWATLIGLLDFSATFEAERSRSEAPTMPPSPTFTPNPLLAVNLVPASEAPPLCRPSVKPPQSQGLTQGMDKIQLAHDSSVVKSSKRGSPSCSLEGRLSSSKRRTLQVSTALFFSLQPTYQSPATSPTENTSTSAPDNDTRSFSVSSRWCYTYR